jgi:pyruvate dehydrogenase E2 component (dihydrolipoamide acetyltransferase)
MGRLGKNLIITEVKTFDIQRRVVAHMTNKSWKNIPHVTINYEPDVTDFMDAFRRFRERRKTTQPDAPHISVNTILLKLIAEGLKAAPQLNSIFSYSSKTKIGYLSICEQINIAIPLVYDGERDITPVIPDVGNKTLDELSLYISDLMRRVKKTNIDQLLFDTSKAERIESIKHFDLGVLPGVFAGLFGKNKVKTLKGKEKEEYYAIPETERLTPADILDGSTLVSNIGSVYQKFRGNVALLEIIPPQTFVVGVSAVQRRPAAFLDGQGKEQMGIRSILPFLLGFDHRPFDFAHVTPFIQQLDEIFENPDNFFECANEMGEPNQNTI